MLTAAADAMAYHCSLQQLSCCIYYTTETPCSCCCCCRVLLQLVSLLLTNSSCLLGMPASISTHLPLADHSMRWILSRQLYICTTFSDSTSRTTSLYSTAAAMKRPSGE